VGGEHRERNRDEFQNAPRPPVRLVVDFRLDVRELVDGGDIVLRDRPLPRNRRYDRGRARRRLRSCPALRDWRNDHGLQGLHRHAALATVTGPL